jgi:hypothetical protein
MYRLLGSAVCVGLLGCSNAPAADDSSSDESTDTDTSDGDSGDGDPDAPLLLGEPTILHHPKQPMILDVIVELDAPSTGELLHETDDGHVRVLTLDRPEARNAFDRSLYVALADALRKAAADDSVHAVVITGAGTGWHWLIAGQNRTCFNRFQTEETLSNNPNGENMFVGSGFSNQGGFQRWAINYNGNASARVRWGFGWNNETDQASNDVSGGIGMDSSYGSFSAGDRINCCQIVTGVNRSARFELWVR